MATLPHTNPVIYSNDTQLNAAIWNKELPLPHTNPVIYSNDTQLNAAIWNKGKSITFEHHYTQIIQNVIVIKIENTTVLSTSNGNITSANFSIIPILGHLNNNNISGVSIGHTDISYDISSKPIMITFLNVDNISAADPFYRENGHDVNSIKEYTKSNILNSSTANTILSNDTNSTYNGTLYTKNVADKRITIWTHHLTYFGIYSTLGDGICSRAIQDITFSVLLNRINIMPILTVKWIGGAYIIYVKKCDHYRLVDEISYEMSVMANGDSRYVVIIQMAKDGDNTKIMHVKCCH